MRDVGQRLRRLLYMVPYVAKHGEGVQVDDLAAMLDLSRDHLLRDLDLLSQVGPPDGDPGEYLLVSVENGRVYIDLPQRLTRPLRLTPAEGCSLLLGIRALRESGVVPFDEAMASAERKLLRVLGRDAEAAEKLATDTVVAQPDRVTGEHLRKLVTAARQRTQVEIEYVAASRPRPERRALRPYGIVHHAGAWYVVGHCDKRGDTRTFRIDRIAALTPTGSRFELPDDFDLETYRREHLYVPSADAVAVQVHLDPLARARVGASWPVGTVTHNADGSAEIVIDCEGFEWVTGWVLGFGQHAWIVQPEEARQAMRERLAQLDSALAPAAPGEDDEPEPPGPIERSSESPEVPAIPAIPEAASLLSAGSEPVLRLVPGPILYAVSEAIAEAMSQPAAIAPNPVAPQSPASPASPAPAAPAPATGPAVEPAALPRPDESPLTVENGQSAGPNIGHPDGHGIDLAEPSVEARAVAPGEAPGAPGEAPEAP